jgi:hypothetical protein
MRRLFGEMLQAKALPSQQEDSFRMTVRRQRETHQELTHYDFGGDDSDEAAPSSPHSSAPSPSLFNYSSGDEEAVYRPTTPTPEPSTSKIGHTGKRGAPSTPQATPSRRHRDKRQKDGRPAVLARSTRSNAPEPITEEASSRTVGKGKGKGKARAK